MPKSLNLVFLGRKGAGKSLSGNTILGKQAFKSKKSPISVTQDVAVESGTVCEHSVTVYDTPGLYDADMNEEEIQHKLEKILQKCESGLFVFLLVIKADEITEKEKKMVEKIENLLGEKRLKKTWILFTRGDELEEANMTIKEFIDVSEPLKNLVQKYDQRYHVFNNKTKGNIGQVQGLFMKIKKPLEGDRLKHNPLRRKIPKDIKPDSPSSRRIVLLGKSGFGKSASGNTILGQREFNSVRSTSSVTRECSEVHATVSGRSVSVVDTPGLFDTKMKSEELAEEIARSVYISSPGPHAFIIVLRANDRFTDQEQQIPEIIKIMFGEEVLNYSIILFTHGDQLEEKSVEELIEENCRLRDLVQQCGGRYHIFNNKDLNNREQVNDLLQKIDTMIEQNGGGHYSNQMFEDAERFRQEEEERRKQQVEKEIQEKIERVRNETTDRVRTEIELERQKESEEKQRQERVKKEEDTSSGFKQFFNEHQQYFYLAAVAIGIAVGGAAGGAVAKVVISGAVAKTAVAGAVVGGATGAPVVGAVARNYAGTTG